MPYHLHVHGRSLHGHRANPEQFAALGALLVSSSGRRGMKTINLAYGKLTPMACNATEVSRHITAFVVTTENADAMEQNGKIWIFVGS